MQLLLTRTDGIGEPRWLGGIGQLLLQFLSQTGISTEIGKKIPDPSPAGQVVWPVPGK